MTSVTPLACRLVGQRDQHLGCGDVGAAAVGRTAELGDAGTGVPIQEQQQRDADADEQAGERVEDEHAEHGRDRGYEVGPLGDREAARMATGVDAVQPPQRGDVDQLDHRGDHDRRQRRVRELLEQAGQQQQREDREDRDDEGR